MISISTETGQIRIPNLLKWVGGKGNQSTFLADIIPHKFNRYFEPFFGGGALFWHLRLRGLIADATISDINPELVNLLQVVRDSPQEFADELEYYNAIRGPENYKKIRGNFNELRGSGIHRLKRASMFLYLNRNSFNGLWRTNSKGEFNVPYGKYKTYWLPSIKELELYSLLLQNVEIRNFDFSSVLSLTSENDFIYFDPPYFGEKLYSFTQYCGSSFSQREQERLADVYRKLTSKGVRCMLSNFSSSQIMTLYENFSFRRLKVLHSVSCKASSRGKMEEVIIINY